jgi:rhodanese-related sulfurtransferase
MQASFQTISAVVLESRIDDGSQLQMVDVRSASEFASGHIPSAINIPMDQVEARLEDLSHTGEIILICQGGKRASITAGWLCQSRNVVVLEGGTDAWQRMGLPLVKCAPCRWSLERQVRFGAGLVISTGAALALAVSPVWAWLSLAGAGGLTFAGLTGICPLGLLLARMPWNKSLSKAVPGRASSAPCCS